MKNVKKRTFIIKRFEKLNSTNSELKNFAEEKSPWMTIRAIEQTAGRGRESRSWHSEPCKDLTFSTLFPLSNALQKFTPNITQVVALAVVNTLEKVGLSPKIKWPNDILIGNKKICGILVEGVYSNGKQELIAGIGLNINSKCRTIAGIEATTMYAETQKEYDIDSIMIQIVESMQSLSHLLLTQGLHSIITMLNSYLAYKGELKQVIIQNKRETVEIIRVTETGELEINNQGKKQIICSGEISFKDV